ncbi:MAG TPA: 2-C-methyl-D-erythritol 4-phosphate cytidylyltransferase [Candidatus Omnitrophota bacterium]|nr:2-C-methyl-D-erythritol 4-phosphate cytidylyltransferase [Candidatus Omnitrophota bacterium]
MKVSVIIAAGGSGKRMGTPKQFLPLCGRPLVEWTVRAFKAVKRIGQIILVVSGDDSVKAETFGVEVATSGPERQDSVKNGLALVSLDCDIVLVHDGARPLITADIIEKAIDAADRYGAAVVGVPVKDTIKAVGDDSFIAGTADRSKLWAAQTPQAFKREIITRAYQNIKGIVTDDSKLAEQLGVKVKMIMGSYENIKITTPEDLMMAEAVLRSRNVLSDT